MRRCATGWAPSDTRITSSGRSSAPIRFPMIVRDFQSMIGTEGARAVHADRRDAYPNYVVASVGRRVERGGDLRIVRPRDASVKLIGVEGRRPGARALGQHAASAVIGQTGAFFTGRSRTFSRTMTGQTADVHSVFGPGLIIPGVGPEHAYWKDSGPRRIHPASPTAEALERVPTPRTPRRHPFLPSSRAHAIAHVAKLAPKLKKDQIVVVNLSGRGDKDCQEVARLIEGV